MPYFATKVLLGPQGVSKIMPVGELDAFEKAAFDSMLPQLKSEIQKVCVWGGEDRGALRSSALCVPGLPSVKQSALFGLPLCMMAGLVFPLQPLQLCPNKQTSPLPPPPFFPQGVDFARA